MPDADAAAKILIVDDDQGLSRLMERALKRGGFITATAGSGKDALAWLVQNTPDLMLLDLKLPDIEGKELINRLAAAGRSVPFIIITGQGDERAAVEMMKRGALDYVIKDVQFMEFVPTVVRRSLERLAKERRLAEAEEALRRSEAMVTRAQEIAHVGSYQFDVPGAERLRWSAETFHILGRDAAQGELSLKEYLTGVIHPDDQARVCESLERTTHEAARYDIEYRIVRPDGSIRHVHSVGEPVLGPDKKVIQVAGSLQDITERKEMEREILEISEREQSRIGQDLHDGLCQHLAGIEFRLLGLKQKLEGRSNKLAAETVELTRLIREGIEQTRTLARGLSPVMLESGGLMNALHELALNTQKAFNISCAFSCPAPVPIQDNAVATHLYRIAQEAVHNAIRHGKAKLIAIHLLARDQRIVLGVKDDGVGFPRKPRKHRGMGLRVMQYRARMVGGSLQVQRGTAGGTSVICSLSARMCAEKTGEPKGKRADA